MGGVSLLTPLWEVREGAILGGPDRPLLSHPAPASQLRDSGTGSGSAEARPHPQPSRRAWGEGKGQAPPAHLLTVKCGHLPSRSSAST